MEQKIIIAEPECSRLEILKKYAEYSDEVSGPFNEVYVFGNYSVDDGTVTVLEKYGYSDYISRFAPCSDELAFGLLHFVCEHFGHNGSGGMSEKRGIADIIEFCENHHNKTNCRGLAVLLASLLRLNGIKARHITCSPYEEPFNDCHVVVDCLLPSERRVMLDPTQRLYYTDENGEYVSLQNLRKLLIDGKPIIQNAEASYNGGKFYADDNREYMTKNTFRFTRGTRNANGVDEFCKGFPALMLIPKGYGELISESESAKYYTLASNEDEFWNM